MDFEGGAVQHFYQAGVGLRDKAEHSSNHDIGMADGAAEPIVRCPPRAVLLKYGECGGDLRAAALYPDRLYFPMQTLFIEKADSLFAHACC